MKRSNEFVSMFDVKAGKARPVGFNQHSLLFATDKSGNAGYSCRFRIHPDVLELANLKVDDRLELLWCESKKLGVLRRNPNGTKIYANPRPESLPSWAIKWRPKMPSIMATAPCSNVSFEDGKITFSFPDETLFSNKCARESGDLGVLLKK